MTRFPRSLIRPQPLRFGFPPPQDQSSSRRVRPQFAGLMLAGLILAFGSDGVPDSIAVEFTGLKPADLYRTTNVWSAHFKFTTEQWQKIEPKGEPGGFFGGGPPNGPRGGGGGGRGGFGPGMFVAPAFMKDGDVDQDAKLSPAEFNGLATKWFNDWDKQKSGKLDADQLRSGINVTFVPPGFGPRRGGPGGGRGPGMNLQGAEGARNGLSSAAGIEFEYVHGDLEF